MKQIISITFLLIAFFLCTCDEKREFNNPVASGVELPAPQGLQAAQEEEWIELTWNKNNMITGGWKMERKTGTTDFLELALLDAATQTFTDTTITTDMGYQYRLRGYSDENETPYSAPVNFTALFPAPTELTATPLSDEVMRLTWKDNCAFEQGYILERKTGQETFVEIKRLPANTTAVNDSGLSYGLGYQYRVKAHTLKNQSGFSNVVSQAMIIPAPGGLTATAISDSEIRLTWTDNCNFESGYLVEKDAGSGFMQIAQVAANSTNYTDNTALWDSEQHYRVRAFTTANQSDYSNETALNPAQSSAPTNLELTEGFKSIQLTWQDNCTFEDGFRIERSDDGGAWTQVAELPSNSTSFSNTGLDNTITYLYRVLAYIGSKQTEFSNEKSGRTIHCTDIDGNTYQIVKIGDQVWMAENLKVTRYRNGESIPNVTDNSQWTNLSTGARCAYNNDNNNVATYGLLYNWHAVNDARGLAPSGWRVPTDEEWKELEMYLGMSRSDADATGWRGSPVGGKLKEADTAHWNSPNEGATNESGFTALPGGYRLSINGTFHDIGGRGYCWSSTEDSSASAWVRLLDYYNSGVYRDGYYKHGGYSVRCVRD